MAINSNKVTRFDESIKLKIFLIASFFFVVFTNNYFSYEQSIVFGARDGVDYFLIAQNFPKIHIFEISNIFKKFDLQNRYLVYSNRFCTNL